MLCTCGHHVSEHSEMAGCLAGDGINGWCPCERFAVDLGDDSAGLAEGRRLRDEGAAAAGTAAPGALVADWKAKAEAALAHLLEQRTPFSADDITAVVGIPPVPNMLGALFVAARRRGRIIPYDYIQSTRPAAHARVMRTWVKA